MSLAFLRIADVYAEFDKLKHWATSNQLVRLVEYIDTQWISHSVWPRKMWTVYRCAVRTNNDVESWHAHFNRKAKFSNLALYKLITLLHKDAKAAAVSLFLLSNEMFAGWQASNIFICIQAGETVVGVWCWCEVTRAAAVHLHSCVCAVWLDRPVGYCLLWLK